MPVGATPAGVKNLPPFGAAQRLRRPSHLWVGLLAAAVLSCSPSAPAQAPGGGYHEPISFSFTVPGEEAPIVSSGLLGRATVVLLMATYDLASQVMASRIGELVRGSKRRANALAVAMEPPSYAHLLPAYRDTLQLPYPVAIADFATLRGEGPFGGVERVPVTVFLNRHGVETRRLFGEQSIRVLEDALQEAQNSDLR